MRWILFIVLWAPAAEALDTLVVGRGTYANARPWKNVVVSTRFAAVSVDSVWTWAAEQGANLTGGLAERGGAVLVEMEVPTRFGTAIEPVVRQGLPRWADGDASTAWGPDDDDEIGRRGIFYIDLGATFRVDRLRFFPRLDSENSRKILGAFAVATASGEAATDAHAPRYRGVQGMVFSAFRPNRQPMVDVTFPRRDVRFIRLQSHTGEPWELAEFEVYAEGTVPMGIIESEPLFIRGSFPIWGQVFYEGGPIEGLPVTVQTRTGPDEEPLHYFLQRGDEIERVSRREYERFDPLNFAGAARLERGPIRPNPKWSTWQTVADGLVLSPAPRRYIQFRLAMAEPGTRLENLLFEYVDQPLVERLQGEISPLVVEAGVETEFTLSLEVHLNPGRGDTGFRYLQVRTPAVVGRVERVLVDDEAAVFSATYQEGEGFTVDIWKRVMQAGTFIQIVFRAGVVRDGTAFEVRALDLRPEGNVVEPVYQMASPGDVDPFSVGGELVVRLKQGDLGLVDALRVERTVITPNGDGVNDFFAVAYNLLKLMRPVPVYFQICDLGGGLVFEGVSEDRHGRYVRLWRGTDVEGRVVAPGLYLYQVRVEADVGVEERAGVVQVIY